MHCRGCADNIEASLTRIEGVRSAVGDHEEGLVEVVHAAGKVSEVEIRGHITELGYEVDDHAEEGTVHK